MRYANVQHPGADALKRLVGIPPLALFHALLCVLEQEVAEARDFETWQARSQKRLSALGLTVGHAVSDRASALIKLALEGFHL